MTLVIFLGSLIGSMALGIPIAFALLVVSVALMFYLDLFDAQIIAQNLLNGADSFPLMAVPFFMLAGEVMNSGGLSKRIVNIAMALVGHKRGGLGYVAIIASCLLASLSGSAVADAAALAALLVPMMVLAGHNRARSAGLIAAGGIIAPVIPPSAISNPPSAGPATMPVCTTTLPSPDPRAYWSRLSTRANSDM